jgi:hypothetical protein
VLSPCGRQMSVRLGRKCSLSEQHPPHLGCPFSK